MAVEETRGWVTAHWNWLLVAGGSVPALAKWGYLIVDILTAPLVMHAIRRQNKILQSTVEDATEATERAQSEVSYWKSDAEYWRGRSAELELEARTKRSRSTTRRKPPSST